MEQFLNGNSNIVNLHLEEDKSPIIFTSNDGWIASVSTVDSNGTAARLHIQTNEKEKFLNRLTGKDFEIIIRLLTKAVNNRTKERNYFRLYCDLLDNTLSDEEFDKEIKEHENQYLISGEERPSFETLKLAIEISKGLMDTANTEDFADLYSFDSHYINSLIPTTDDKIH